MDLNSFLGSTQKTIYKITFLLAESKIIRFISAHSQENAKYLLEEQIRKECHGAKLKVLDVKDITKKPSEADVV